ncbi:MAG: (2Fe-2S)-binding protein, partial [Deltaproteobacteria bacterium]
MVDVTLIINGSEAVFSVEPEERLVDTLRWKAGLTGTKVGCGIGECGACSVFLDGELVPSCLVLTVAADGRRVDTIEGLSADGRLTDLQRAFVEEGAVQCGYCTPGFLISAAKLLE